MRFFILFILLFCSCDSAFLQVEELRYNSWYSLSYNCKLKKRIEINLDGGIRFCNHFINRNRQNLIRVILERKVSQMSLGVGYAYFNSYNLSQKTFIFENRPFVQLKWNRQLTDKLLFFSRFRSEFRIFENQSFIVNRNRLQVGGEYICKKNLNPKVNYELFYSNLSVNNYEQKFSIGNTLKFNKLKLYIFYTIQLQQSVRFESKQLFQKIIGIQVQF